MTRTSPRHDSDATPGAHLPVDTQCEPTAGDLLRMDVHTGPDGTTRLRVAGEIDLATSPLLRSRAMEQLGQAAGQLVLDLQNVDFLGSAGLAVLIEIRNEAQRRDIGLQLVTTSRAVLRPLIATGIIDLFNVDTGSSPQYPPRQEPPLRDGD